MDASYWPLVSAELEPGGEDAPPVKVDDYNLIQDRLQFIAVLFRRWQQSPRLQDEPFDFEQRTRERMILTSTIEPEFDSGLGDRAMGGVYATTSGEMAYS